MITKLLAKDPNRRPTVPDALALLDAPPAPTRAYEPPCTTISSAAPQQALDTPASTPLARLTAAELGVKLGLVKGTGAGGRIWKTDVLAAAGADSVNVWSQEMVDRSFSGVV